MVFLFCLGPGVFLLVSGLPLSPDPLPQSWEKAVRAAGQSPTKAANRLLLVPSLPTVSHEAFVGGLSAPYFPAPESPSFEFRVWDMKHHAPLPFI